MQKTNTLRLIPALIAVAFSGSALAAGFQLNEYSVGSMGTSYAGTAVTAENASTIFYNPAIMTQLQDREVSVGATYVKPSFKFTNGSSSVGTLGTAGDGGDGGKAAVIPNFSLSWALTKDLYLGLSVGAPFGLMTDYDRPWKGAAQSEKFSVETININPSLAWRANDMVSLGFGVNWQKLDADYVRQVAVTTPGLAGVASELKLSGDAWGWNAGALFKLSPATKVGVSYRSVIKVDATGDVTLSSNAAGAATMAGLVAQGAASNASATVKLPDSFILSGSHKFTDQLEGLADVAWTGWSSIPKIDIMRTSGPLAANAATSTAQTLDTKFRDTWRVSVGAAYQLNDAWKLRTGLAYDQSPVRGAAERMVSLPDNDRILLSLGTQWKLSKVSSIDLGAMYLYLRDADINNNQTVAPTSQSAAARNRGTVNGTYKDSAILFGAQFSMAF